MKRGRQQSREKRQGFLLRLAISRQEATCEDLLLEKFWVSREFDCLQILVQIGRDVVMHTMSMSLDSTWTVSRPSRPT